MGEKGYKMAEVEETTTEEQTTGAEEPEDSLDSILEGKELEEAPEPEPEAAKEEEVEAKAGEEAPDAGESEDLTDEQITALPAKEQGFYKSMKSERGKRQEFQKRFEEAAKSADESKLLLQQATELIKNFQANPAAIPAEDAAEAKPLDFWDDPKAFIAEQLKGVTGQISEGTAQAQKDRLTLFENAATQRHEDFAEVNQLFMQTLMSHPDKAQAEQVRLSVVNSADPGEAAYQYGLKLRSQAEIAEAGGVDALVAKKIAEGLAAAQNTAEEDNAEGVLTAATLPKPMANRRAAGGATKPLTGYEADQSLSEIIGN